MNFISSPIASYREGNPSPQHPEKNRRFCTLSAFSLVEVALAMGIATFAILAVVGLLPVGLRSVKNAGEQAGAASVAATFAESLRTATSSNSIDFTGTFAGQAFVYTIGGGVSTNRLPSLTIEGATTTNALEGRLSAVVFITPPPNAITPGRAVVSVAWPAASSPLWNNATQKWTQSEGSVTSGMQFLPQP